MKRTNKPFKNYQKKKYYTNRNTRNKKVPERSPQRSPQIEYFFDPLKEEWGSRIIK